MATVTPVEVPVTEPVSDVREPSAAAAAEVIPAPDNSASTAGESSSVPLASPAFGPTRMLLRQRKIPRGVSLTVKDEKEVKQELGENDFIVERVLGYKQVNKIRYARIKWRGFRQTSWEPYESIFYVSAAELKKDNAKEKEDRERRRLKAESERRRLERQKVPVKVIGKRERGGKTEYKIRWKGHPRVADSWLAEDKLNRPDLVADIGPPSTIPVTVTDDVPIPPPLPLASLHARTPILNEVLAAKGKPAPASRKVTFEQMEERSSAPTPPSSQPSTSNHKIRPVVLPKRRPRKPPTLKATPKAPPPAPVIFDPLKTSPAQLLGWRGPADGWSVADVGDCLMQYGFADIVHKFRDKRIDGPALLRLADAAAVQKEIQIPLGPSLKISKLVKDLQELLKK